MSAEKQIAAIPGLDTAARARLRANAERLAASGSATQQADARAVLAALDAQAATDHETRQSAPLARLVTEAFTAEPPTETDRQVLQALLDHPASTAEDLSAACGWDGGAWQLHFGSMCERRKVWLPDPDYVPARNGYFYSGLLADLDEHNRFTMKPEAAEGLAAVGIGKGPAS
ncbi:MAG: hypothetical protein KDC18_01205 [Alphaproteobacteria bacterium]|nr:hypothetical protein [Alphaproteobacteria bacterium]MCB9928233.1 hypothetical protein [Alphaproteobacteria bacterium]